MQFPFHKVVHFSIREGLGIGLCSGKLEILNPQKDQVKSIFILSSLKKLLIPHAPLESVIGWQDSRIVISSSDNAGFSNFLAGISRLIFLIVRDLIFSSVLWQS